MVAQKRLRVEPAAMHVQKKTAIELEMEEAEEYERRKETEQRRLQQIKLQSLDETQKTRRCPAPRTSTSEHATLHERRSTARAQLAVERYSKAFQLDEHSEYSDGGSSNDSKTGQQIPLERRPAVCPTIEIEKVSAMRKAESDQDVAVTSSEEDLPISSHGALGKLRLPRSLLEKWVEEPFFEKAVIGCFVRLGVGKAPGLRGDPQYKVCEIVGVEEYKHSYAFGEFETKKALMLRIGRNQRLWRMNVISNHRFTAAELDEWRNIMIAERQRIPTSGEIDKRKICMRKAVFGIVGVQSLSSGHGLRPNLVQHELKNEYSELDVSRLVDARRKRNEAARFRERQTATVTRLNHGQTRTRYEHEVYGARDAYAALLIAQSKELHATPELQTAICKVEYTEAWQRADNDGFERDLDALALRLLEAQREHLSSGGETKDCRAARRLHRETRQKLIDFRKNALEIRKKRNAEAPSRTSSLHLINEAKKHENALADMAYGEKKKLQDEQNRDEDGEHSIFQRRATKPMMLWTTSKEPAEARTVQGEAPPSKSTTTPTPTPSTIPRFPLDHAITRSHQTTTDTISGQKNSDRMQKQRQRNGMSLQEYVAKARASAENSD